MTRRNQRRLATLTVVVSGVALVLGQAWAREHLRGADRATGWLLAALVVALASLGVRKKLPFLPLGRTAVWLRFHLVIGSTAILTFVFHTGARWPNGVLEVLLALTFWTVALSGVLGIVLARTLARRLAARGGEVIYERIPALRRALTEQAQELALTAFAHGGSRALADFHATRLLPFLQERRNLWPHLIGSARPRQRLIGEIAGLERYLRDEDREILGSLRSIVRTKDDLDHHAALQGALKWWLYVHLPGTSALLILAIVHGVLASAFGAAAP